MGFLTSIKNIFIVSVSIILIESVLCNGMETFPRDVVDISYDELKDMGADCNPLDNCKKSRRHEDLGKYNCNCGNTCPEFDTCCLDSEYRSTSIPKAVNSDIKCLPLYRSGIGAYMIDKCENGDSEIGNLCKSNGETENDPFLMIPVTSLATKITYKNYFCLHCNEDVDKDQVVMWNLRIKSKSKAVDSSNMPDLSFDNFTRSWMVVDNSSSEVATLTIEIAEKVTSFVKICKAGDKGLISNCSEEWEDEIIAQKCAAYMAIVGFSEYPAWKWYRNPHCALCNFEDVKRRFCKQGILETRWTDLENNYFIRLFELRDEETACGRKMIYDKFAKKCRCNSRDSFMQDGKCVSRTT